ENETANSLLTRIEVLGEQHLQKYNQLEDRLETRFGSQIKEVGQAQLKLQEIEERSNRQQLEIRNLRMRAALQQAVSRGLKARIHLAEQSSGLAERDLTEAGSALQSAFGIAPKELKPRIEETIRSLNELKQSVEARTFPVASVEMMTDRIDALIVVETIGD
ncbi:MAG: hypothetical protein Q7T05_06615, partial [Dehalococcoidia bacterium]|nr:hypothetical protein [Dehalococcoidia bacterium]